MKIDYNLDRGRADALVDDALEAGQGILKIRVQPQLYLERHGNKQYVGWKGVYWNSVLTNRQEAFDLRAALAGLFAAITVCGAEQVISALDSLIQARVESAAK